MTIHIRLQESLTSGEFPLWDIYTQSGTPLFAGPQVGFFSIATLLNLIVGSSYAAVKLSLFLLAITSGIGMYYLLRSYNLAKHFAFFGSFLYLVNGTAAYFFYSYPFWSTAYALLPLTIMFTKLALEKNLKYAIFTGIILALVFLSGATSGFLYSLLFLGLFLLYSLWGKKFSQRFWRAFLVGLILSSIMFGLVAIKALPAREFVSFTQRAASEDLPYEYFVGGTHKLTGDNFFRMLVRDADRPYPTGYDGSGQIGFIALGLIILSLPLWKMRKFFFFQLALVAVVLYMFQGPVSWFIWKFVPIFNQQKNLDKALFLYNFAASIVATIGLVVFWKFLSSWKRGIAKYGPVLLSILCLLVLFELGFANHLNVSFGGDGFDSYEIHNRGKYGAFHDVQFDIAQTPLMSHLTTDNDLYRVRFYETRVLSGGINSFTVPSNIEVIYGNNNIWHQDYALYLLALQQYNNPAKLYGIQNVKYIASPVPLDFPGLTLVEQYPTVPASYPAFRIAQGPYLYENDQFLPRAYSVSDAVLVVGDHNPAMQTMYTLMFDERYDPSTLLFTYEGNSVPTGDLSRYSAIILTQGAQNLDRLQQYSGSVLPDVRKGEQQVREEDVAAMFTSGMDAGQVDIISRTSNELVVRAPSGWLFVSEKYSLFPGWNAKGRFSYDIAQSQGSYSAVYVAAEDTITFSYLPSSFAIGAWISGLTLLGLLSYGGYVLYSRKKKINQKTDTEEDKTTP